VFEASIHPVSGCHRCTDMSSASQQSLTLKTLQRTVILDQTTSPAAVEHLKDHHCLSTLAATVPPTRNNSVEDELCSQGIRHTDAAACVSSSSTSSSTPSTSVMTLLSAKALSRLSCRNSNQPAHVSYWHCYCAVRIRCACFPRRCRAAAPSCNLANLNLSR
jgi:hypothetical protein